VVAVDRLLDDQEEMLVKLRQAVRCTRGEFDSLYLPVIRGYAAFVHLLPASEAHHHRGAGGLLRHGLEVAFLVAQGVDSYMFGLDETPARRKLVEPRWHFAAFISGLCHDVGKPVADMAVVDSKGTREWNPYDSPLLDWARTNSVDHYFVRWRANRHNRHKQVGNLILPKVLPDVALKYIASIGGQASANIMHAMTEAVAGSSTTLNPLLDLVIKYDQASVERDLKRMGTVDGVSLAVPVEKHLLDAMRRITKGPDFKINVPGAGWWMLGNALYLVWPETGKRIVELLRQDNVPGIPQDPDTIADILIERNIATASADPDGVVFRYWGIRPDALTERADVTLRAIKIQDASILFDTIPSSVPGEVVRKGARTKPQEEEKAPPGRMSLQPQREVENDIPSPPPDLPIPEIIPDIGEPPPGFFAAAELPSAPEAQERQTDRPTGTEPSQQDAGGEDPFSNPDHSIVGEVLRALAEDLAAGRKQWGKDVAIIKGNLAVKHPDAWGGYGVEPKQLLVLLSEADWIEPDPFAPMRKLREAEGYFAKALFMDTNITEAFLRVSGQPKAAPPAEKPNSAAGEKAPQEQRTKTADSKASKQPQRSKEQKKSKPKSEPTSDSASQAPAITPADAPTSTGEPKEQVAAPESVTEVSAEPPKPRRRLSAVKPLGVPKSPLADLPEFTVNHLPPVPEVVDGSDAPLVAGAVDVPDPEIIDMSPPAASPATDAAAQPKATAGADRARAAIAGFVAAVRASEIPGIQTVEDGLALPLYDATNWIAQHHGKSMTWANRTLSGWDKSQIVMRELSGRRMVVVLE